MRRRQVSSERKRCTHLFSAREKLPKLFDRQQTMIQPRDRYDRIFPSELSQHINQICERREEFDRIVSTANNDDRLERQRSDRLERAKTRSTVLIVRGF